MQDLGLILPQALSGGQRVNAVVYVNIMKGNGLLQHNTNGKGWKHRVFFSFLFPFHVF